MIQFIQENKPLVAVLLLLVAALTQTAAGKQVLYLCKEAVDCALSMAEGYNEQYRVEDDEAEMNGDGTDKKSD